MKNLIIYNDIAIKEALKLMNISGEKCLVITDRNNTLLGTLSDGDLRKAILKGANLFDSICDIYQQNPTTLLKGTYNHKKVKNIFIENNYNLLLKYYF